MQRFFSVEFGLAKYLHAERDLLMRKSLLVSKQITYMRVQARCNPCVPLAIKTIMIVLFEILTLFHFKAIGSSWLTLNEILIVSMAKGTQ